MNQLALFNVIPTLTLELQDPATSDDPLEIFLQRRHWDLAKVRALQESISAKCTIDMFGRKEEFSPLEVLLQEDIDRFINGGN